MRTLIVTNDQHKAMAYLDLIARKHEAMQFGMLVEDRHGNTSRWITLSDNSRAHRASHMYIDRNISLELYTTLLLPMLRYDPGTIEWI